MDPIEKIIERLKKENEKNGAWYMLEYWYTRDLRKPDFWQPTYYKIYGFLYGLYAREYISESEFNEATNYTYEKVTRYSHKLFD